MEIIKLEIETDLFRKNVYQLDDIFDGKEFYEQEEIIYKDFKPYYIQCLVESADIKLIHSLEDIGFRFVEFRVINTLLSQNFNLISDNAFYPYQLQLITNKLIFKKAELLLKESFSDDRFSNDPLIKKNISKDRIVSYLHKSFVNQPGEFLYGLINATTDEMVAFKSGEIFNNNEVMFYLNGSKKKQDDSKFYNMLDNLLISSLITQGIIEFHSITSGYNFKELNLYTHNLNFNIQSTKVLLRKIYN